MTQPDGTPTTPPTPPARTARRRAMAAVLAAILFAGFALGAWWSWRHAPASAAPVAEEEEPLPTAPPPADFDVEALGRIRRDAGWALERIRRLDGGQGLKDRIDAAGRLWWRGERFYFADPPAYPEALAAYRDVTNACNAVFALNNRRKAAAATRDRATAAQGPARDLRAVVDATALWNRAERSYRRGGLHFERGRFDEAFAEWISSAQDYADAAREARNVQEERRRLERERLERERLETIAACIRRAERAGGHKRWKDMRAAAQEALALDPSNQKAADLLIDAERHLLPTVTLTATARGKEVEAAVSGADFSGTTPRTFSLEKGESYSASLLYQSGNYYYAGSVTFTVTPDWEGERFIDVPLERLNDWLVTLSDGVRLKMKWIPSGSFDMGADRPDGADERPIHRVTISKGFWIGESEVTQSQWEALMGDAIPPVHPDPRFPMENITWEDAAAFCDALNKRDQHHLPKNYRYALPTEAQWEYACRAGTATAYSFGDDPADLHRHANYCDLSNTGELPWKDLGHDDGFDATAPVKSLEPNPWGLYDMHGNVWEWCNDWSGPYPEGAVTDPLGAPVGTLRIYRGGAYNRDADFCRSSKRFSNDPTTAHDNIGFRLVLAPER